VTFCGRHSNKNNPLWVSFNQNNPLWVNFKHLCLSVGVYSPVERRFGLYTPFFYVWTVIDGHRTREKWMRMWQAYMTMKNHHHTSFVWRIQCEWSISCTCQCTYCDTTPLNLLLKSACTAHPILNACSTVLILTNTVISKQVYTQVQATHRMSFCSETVTHKQFIRLSVTHRKSLYLSVTHKKLFLLKVSHRKFEKLQSYPQKDVFV